MKKTYPCKATQIALISAAMIAVAACDADKTSSTLALDTNSTNSDTTSSSSLSGSSFSSSTGGGLLHSDTGRAGDIAARMRDLHGVEVIRVAGTNPSDTTTDRNGTNSATGTSSSSSSGSSSSSSSSSTGGGVSRAADPRKAYGDAAAMRSLYGIEVQRVAAADTRDASGKDARSDTVARADRKFLEDAGAAGMFEVEAAKLAVERARDPAVKSYAQMLVSHHTTANSELMQLATARNVEVKTELPLLKRRGLDKLRKASEGREFDREFVKEIGIDQHQDDIKLFEKTSKSAKDPEIQAWATKTLPTLRQHLADARALPVAGGNSNGAASGASSAPTAGTSRSGTSGDSSTNGGGTTGSGNARPGATGTGTGTTGSSDTTGTGTQGSGTGR